MIMFREWNSPGVVLVGASIQKKSPLLSLSLFRSDSFHPRVEEILTAGSCASKRLHWQVKKKSREKREKYNKKTN